MMSEWEGEEWRREMGEKLGEESGKTLSRIVSGGKEEEAEREEDLRGEWEFME